MREFKETTMGKKIAAFLDDDGILSSIDKDPDTSVAESVCSEMTFVERRLASVVENFVDDDGILARNVEDLDSASITELPADVFIPIIKQIWRAHIEDVRSVLGDHPGLRLSQGRRCVQVSVVLPEKVMKQMTFLPPVMGAGAYSPRRRAVANANYKKLMCIVDQLNKTCKASSGLESMKEPSRTNVIIQMPIILLEAPFQLSKASFCTESMKQSAIEAISS